MLKYKLGDWVKLDTGHEGPITKLEKDTVSIQLTQFKERMDFSDYTGESDDILYTHIEAQAPISFIVKKVKAKW